MPNDETNTTATPVAETNPPVEELPVTAPADSIPDPVDNNTPAPADESVDDKNDNFSMDNGSAELAPPPIIYSDVAEKISAAHNVLIALSSDPSVDEISTAIGLSLYLDKLGKRATAIYSGSAPNALEFLKPEETFSPTADTLQDFVIAINKEKADHLRYKIDGDYVKIFITPYRTRIAEDDLDFSYGDFNVDLVLALNIANGIDLDAALREHGRIMHDAVVVNVTTGNPGKFGEIEWSDKTASSVSEMVARLIYSAKSEVKIEKDEATAFLTGIVAATNRFSNAKTTPETMKVASLLMESGANQQLISKNITPEVENQLHGISHSLNKKSSEDDGESSGEGEDSTSLEIDHTKENKAEENDSSEVEPEAEKTEEKPAEEKVEEKPAEEKPAEEKVEEKPAEEKVEEKPAEELDNNGLLDDLKAAEASLSMAGAEATPDIGNRPVRVEDADVVLPKVQSPDTSAGNDNEKVIEPTADFSTEISSDGSNKYGKMLEDALAEAGVSADEPNPAAMNTPTVASTPEINGVPEINYATPADEEILPPPPAPPVNMDMPTAMTTEGLPFVPSMPETSAAPSTSSEASTAPSEPSLPSVSSTPSASNEPSTPNTLVTSTEPSIQAEPSAPSTPNESGASSEFSLPNVESPAENNVAATPSQNDPGAFKIPGM